MLVTYRVLVPVGVTDSAEQVVTRLARCRVGGAWFATAAYPFCAPYRHDDRAQAAVV